MADKEHIDIRKSPWLADFPIFKNVKVNGKPLTYLDTSASAQKPQSVIDRIACNYSHEYANVHRGLYSLSEHETAFMEEARVKVKDFIGAKDSSEIIFTKGATEAINLAANTWGRQNLTAADEVLITEAEHHANLIPWQLLAEHIGFTIKVAKVTDAGELDMDSFNALLSEKTKLVAVTQMSNVLGTIMPIKDIAKKAHAAGATVLVDGAQGVAHTLVSVADMDCDFYAFSGHKLYGPTGIGVLYGKKHILENLNPWQGGGDMIKSASFKGSTWTTPPVRFEAGTPPFVEAIGLGAAIDYLTAIGMQNILNREEKVFSYLFDKIEDVEGARILGKAKEKGALVSFVIDGINPQDMAMILAKLGICIRVGHHCAQPIVERFGLTATARASLGMYNGTDDVDALIGGLIKVKDMLK